MNEHNRVSETKGWRYSMEPGDGTHYEFSLVSCNPRVTYGVGTDTSEFVTLVIHSPGSGAYEVRRSALREPAMHYIRYLYRHFTAANYTLAAIVLACSILVDDAGELDRAAAEMLKANALLHEED